MNAEIGHHAKSYSFFWKTNSYSLRFFDLLVWLVDDKHSYTRGVKCKPYLPIVLLPNSLSGADKMSAHFTNFSKWALILPPPSPYQKNRTSHWQIHCPAKLFPPGISRGQENLVAHSELHVGMDCDFLGFPRGGANPKCGAPAYYFAIFFPKTAWK